MKNEPTVSRPVRIVVIGAGNRANKYLEYATGCSPSPSSM